MNAEDRKLKLELVANHGPIAYAVVQRLGAIACTLPTEERYLEFVSAVGDPGESSGIAREQLVFELLVYPKEEAEKARVRKFLKAMPEVTRQVSLAIESLCCGAFTEPKTETVEDRVELDRQHEFGWKVIVPEGYPRIVLATDPTAGSLARGVIEAKERGDDDLGPRMRTASLAFVREPERDAVEVLLSKRPAMLMPLWMRCHELTGAGAVELGKD